MTKKTLKILLLVGVAAFAIVVFVQGSKGANNDTNLPETVVTSGRYENPEIGLAFMYPEDWGAPVDQVQQDLRGFFFEISFANGFWLGGVSNPYEPYGRGPGDMDVTPELLENGCIDNGSQMMVTASGISATYAQTLVDPSGSPCEFVPEGATGDHYVAFPQNQKFTNLVIRADSELFTKEEVETVVRSLEF